MAWAGHPGRDNCADMHWVQAKWEKSASRPSTTDFGLQAHCTLKWLGLDISGPFATAPHKEQFMVSIVDYHSGYPEVLLTMDICSSAIIRWLKELFSRHGCPDKIVMDNGPQFASSEFQQFLTEHGVHALMTTIYNPRENGLVECWNKTLKFSIQAFTSSGKQWDNGIL